MNVEKEIKEETIGLTTFAQEEPVVEANMVNEGAVFDPYEDQGLSTILSRPYQVDTLVWTGSSTTGTALAVYQFPSVLFNEPTIWAKLQRFMYFRADVRVSFRVNATRFHYGRLLVSWLPNYDPCDPLTEVFPQYKESKFGNLYVQSCNPSMEISANVSDPVSFVIPCIIPIHMMNLSTYASGGYNLGMFGSVVVRVLAPLGISNTTTTPTVDLAVTANFENVKVAGMCSVDRGTYARTVNDVASIVGQSALSGEAKSKSKDKLVSGVALTASKFFGDLKDVPVVGATAGLLSSAFKFVGAGARAIGFDKPTTVESTTTVAPRIASDMAHGEGLDLSQKLTLTPTTQSGRSDVVFGQDMDTSISGISRRLCLVNVLAADGSAEVGSVVAAFPVTPMLCSGDEFSATAGWICPTLGAHIGRFFQWWRGSMRFSIRFVCSSFTTARVRIGWHPVASSTPPDLGVGAGDYVSKVVDINGDTSVDFVVPYLQSEYWSVGGKLMPWKRGVATVPWAPEGYCNGAITISIVNPARSADNTANATIYCIVYSAIGPDMQFGGPRGLDGSNRPLVGQSRMLVSPSRSLDDAGDVQTLVPVKGTAVDSGVGVCESVRDLKDYCKRYHLTSPNISYFETSWGVNRLASTSVAASATDTVVMPLEAGPLGRPNWVTLMSIFLGFRGSIRFKLMFTTSTRGESVRCFVTSTPVTSGGTSAIGLEPTGSAGSACGAMVTTPEVSVEVPYNVPYAYLLPVTSACRSHDRIVVPFIDRRKVVVTNYSDSGSTDALNYVCFSAIGDDAEFGIMCAPPMVYADTQGFAVLKSGAWPW